MEHTETGERDSSESALRLRTDRESATEEGIEWDGALADLDLLVVGTFSGGGIHRYIEEQVERLRETVAVETHDMASPESDSGLLTYAWGVILGLVAMARFPTRDRPDVVHIHTSHRFSFYRASAYVLFAEYVWDVPIVLHIHGSSFDEFVATDSQSVAALQRLVFDISDEIIVLSEYWKETVSVRADADRVRVLPNAVDPSAYPVDDETTGSESVKRTNGDAERAIGQNGDRLDATDGVRVASIDGESASDAGAVPHVVFVSNLIERKGVRELAAALDHLLAERPGEFRVTIAGDGPLSGRIEQLATEHEAVSYLGYVSEERKRALLADGSIYVLPTYAEGLPIAMLEGMAGKNAIISTTVGSIPEVIGEDRGVLVEPGDVDGLVEALDELIASHERRARMAANNRRAVEREYSWDRIRQELLDIYRTHA